MVKTPSRATKVVAVAAVLLVAGTGTAYAVGRGHKGAARARSGVTAVEVALAAAGTAASELSLSGSVAATSSLPVAAGASGRISVLDVSTGQRVAAGQALMSVSDPVLQAQLAAAQAAVATAQAKLTAAEAPPSATSVAVAADGVAKAQAALAAAQSAYQQAAQPAATSKRGGSTASTSAGLGASAQAVAVAQAALNLAEAQAAQAQAPPSGASLAPLEAAVAQAQAAQAVIGTEIAQESLTAPFAGTVSSLSAVVGQTVTAGTTVLTLDSTGMSVQAPVSQASLSLVRKGETATVSLLGAPTTLPAAVTAVSPSASPSSLTFDVTISPVSPPPTWLHPGEAATVAVVTSTTPTAVLVPSSSIVDLNGHPQVFVVNRGGKPAATGGSASAATSRSSGAGNPKRAHKGTGKKGRKGRRGRKAHGSAVRRGAGTVSLVDVTPSVSDGTTTEVSGLSPGAAVVVAGQTYLAPGDRVRVTGTVAVPTSVTGSSVGGLLTAPGAAGAGATSGAGSPTSSGSGAG